VIRGWLVIDATLVTIHGFGSSSETWERLTAKWHADDKLNGLRIEPFAYPSPRIPRLPLSPRDVPDYDDIAQTFATTYRVRFAALSDIAIVTHSQGGLILQRFLTWMLDQGRGRELGRIRTIVMLACPNGGSEYLRSIRSILGADRNPQVASLQVLDRQVADTNRRVLANIVNAKGVGDHHCRIPFHVYAGDSDAIVPSASAQGAFPDAWTLPGDHFSILDPAARGNLTAETVSYHILADAGAAVSPNRARVPLDDEGRPTTDPAIREPSAGRAYRFRVTNVGKAPMLDLRPELIDAAGEPRSAPLPGSFLGALQPGERTEFILTVTEPADRNPLYLRYTWTDWGGQREHVSNVTVPPS
jgi:pimeloyl-ACP methyl ester carboxylesterase